MNHNRLYLESAARAAMLENGFHPDIPPEVHAQLQSLGSGQLPADGNVKDLRYLPWSSIDNDSSLDLDQVEVVEPLDSGAVRLRVGIADVDVFVPIESAIDHYAAGEGTSVYTGVRTFPMLPPELSNSLTSLLEGADKRCIVIEMEIATDASIRSTSVYPAVVRNKAQLTYTAVGAWLQGSGPVPPKIADSQELQSQIRMQDQLAQRLRECRYRQGALNIDSIETQPITLNGNVTGLVSVEKNRASELIEDFMIAANSTVARSLAANHVSAIRRVVRTPERWGRIVELAAQQGEHLPPEPDSGALNAFLLKRKAADPLHSADLSLAVVKLMGPGAYVLEKPDDPREGHFGLAVRDYTHSTAPNRRFADLITQRLIKAMIARERAPYSDDELADLARNCTQREDAARKVERVMSKRIAATALEHRIGEKFKAIVTGVTPKGTFVRVLDPHAEGRLVRGEEGVDVGDSVNVRLLSTDVQRGFIDFGR
jgi:exoribonuclease-2